MVQMSLTNPAGGHLTLDPGGEVLVVAPRKYPNANSEGKMAKINPISTKILGKDQNPKNNHVCSVKPLIVYSNVEVFLPHLRVTGPIVLKTLLLKSPFVLPVSGFWRGTPHTRVCRNISRVTAKVFCSGTLQNVLRNAKEQMIPQVWYISLCVGPDTARPNLKRSQ